MEVKSIFRNLATNQFLPELDYIDFKFSFQTVFYKSLYSHCCCPCAFQHEYIEYVSNTGMVNEEIFETVLNNIVNGKCPHVDDANEVHVRETSIYAIHIAAAVGTEEAIKILLDNYQIRRGEILRLSPYRSAVLKAQYNIIDLFTQAIPKLYTDSLSSVGSKVMYPSTLEKGRNTVKIEWITTLEYSVRTRNMRLLNCILSPNVLHRDLNKALEFFFQNSSTYVENLLFGYLRAFNSNEEEKHLWLGCITAAILYDKPEVLDKVLKICHSKTDRTKPFIYLTTDLLKLVNLLGRHNCCDVIKKYDIDPFSHLTVVKHLLTSCIEFNDPRNEMDCVLDKFSQVFELKSDAYVLLEILFGQEPLQFDKVKKFLGNVTWINMELILTESLSYRYLFMPNFRKIFELMLFENPCQELCPSVVKNAFVLDKIIEKSGKMNVADYTGEYIMDCKEHAIFGSVGKAGYALNFLGPVLLESGFPCSTQDLQMALQSRPQSNDELAYIQSYLNTPRSLAVCCRTVLRRHFKRRQIHSYVETAEIPELLKDFILLRPILSFTRLNS